ncbi:MAG: phosphopentomutase [Verrucomicrobiales bacterium]|nr:phosphopentomutase [Verrucomicrobiales bacterium]
MKQALLIVLDSVGIGYAPDAASFGDHEANTVRHIRETVAEFRIPHLDTAGLRASECLSAGEPLPTDDTSFSFGALTEISAGKDTTAGHWEIAGSPVLEPFQTYDRFPRPLVSEMESRAGVNFIGNYAQSGTLILEELGERHCRTKNPILYTSADSVIQIAAHEDIIPLESLYEICHACRRIADRERIGRVIARPFIGEPGNFSRTPNRRDFSMLPPETVLNRLSDNGIQTTGVGKISEIFAGSGISRSYPTKNNAEGCRIIDKLLAEPSASSQLIFANLVDFDTLFGHRRDPSGYAAALRVFDEWLGTLLPKLDDEILVILTADHGNDPTWPGNDHTRERVPLLAHTPQKSRNLGIRESYADIAASLSVWFDVDHNGLAGKSFIE